MSRRRALFTGLLLSSVAASLPVAAQTVQTNDALRPIAPAETYRPPLSGPAATGTRLDVPPLGGAAAASTSGGRSTTGWQTRNRSGDADQQRDRLRRLDENTLAGGDAALAGGAYGVDPADPDPLAGGDYGVSTDRPAPTVTIAPSVLGDPLAAAPRGFRNSPFSRRRLPDPATLTGPGETDPNDPYAPLGVRAGAFLLRPSIETAAGFDTNPDRTVGGKSSGYGRLRGELDAQSDWERHALEFRGSAEGRKDFAIKDSGYEPQINANLSGRIDVTERTQINTELRGSIASARPGTPETPTNIDGEEITRSAGATLGVAQRFNRLSMRLDGLVDRFTVDNARQKDGVFIDNADRAYNQYEVRLRGAYEISPKLEPFTEVAVNTRDYDLTRAITDPSSTTAARKLGSDGWAIRAGSRFELTRLVTGEASIGYGRQTPVDKRFKPVEGLLFDGSVAWAPSALTTVRLTTGTSFQETSLLNSGGVLTRTFGASVEHRLRRNWSVTARAGFERAEYKDTDPALKTDQTTIGLDTEYRLNRNVALTGSLEKLWANYSLPDQDYNATIVEFGLKFRR